MRENIAVDLDIPVDQVSVKATTEEGLGFTGSGEGISAQAVCLLEKYVNYFSTDMTEAGRVCAGCCQGGCAEDERETEK